MSYWKRSDALKQAIDDVTTTIPLIQPDFKLLDSRFFVWDIMPMRNLDCEVMTLNGWSIIFTLTAVKDTVRYKSKSGGYNIEQNWLDRHAWARICYWYSKDGENYKYGGRVMKEGVSPTSREWSGSAILLNEQGELELYYTCVVPDARICKVAGKIITSDERVTLSGFDNVEVVLKADGKYYQTEEQNPYFNFRDPFPFRDPINNELYLLFEGNVAGDRGTHTITNNEDGVLISPYSAVGRKTGQVGCIGLAKANNLRGDDWTLLKPLVTAVGVNDQLERPHFIFKDQKYYLFFASHSYTFSSGIKGADGLYGFVSDGLFSEYKPLNSSGLVLGNPSSQPYQSYSHYVMPNLLVASFIDNVPIPKLKTYRIGGTLAPTIKINIDGDRTYIENVLNYGYIPPSKA